MQPSNLKLAESASYAAAMKAELLAAYPDLSDDNQALLDTLDGLTDLSEVIAVFVRSADDDLALAAGCGDRIDELGTRKSRFLARAETKRRLIQAALERAGLKKVEHPEFTAFTRASAPTVIITHEDAITADYLTQKVVTGINKNKIKSDLLDGKQVPGARLSNGGTTLTIRKT